MIIYNITARFAISSFRYVLFLALNLSSQHTEDSINRHVQAFYDDIRQSKSESRNDAQIPESIVDCAVCHGLIWN